MLQKQHERHSSKNALKNLPSPDHKKQEIQSDKNEATSYFGDLRSLIADGWEIVQPIFARPLWSSVDDSKAAFHFVLQRDRSTRLITIPRSPTALRFIKNHALQVQYPA